MKNTSYIELSKTALRKNIEYLNQRIGDDTKFCSVIKGNAYGHGVEHFMKMVENCGIDYFAVFDASEAEKALNVKEDESHIMIMGMIENSELEWAIEHDISFYVFEFDRLNHAIQSAKKLEKKAKIHIELETGLNRTGFEKNTLGTLVDIIHDNMDYLEIEGICTHYAGAESVANYVRIQEQIEQFNKTIEWFSISGINPNYRHTACSAAALTYPETKMDMVRFGIAHYGFWPSRETKMYNLLSDDTTFTSDPLHRILSWKSTVMSIKRIPKGKFINYGTSYLTIHDKIVAGIPVGYYHGYSRKLSNQGHVLIHGRKAPVLGLINMNMMLVDVSNIPQVKKGDEVVLIGTQQEQQITVASFLELSKYINYEFLTRLPTEIPRFVVE